MSLPGNSGLQQGADEVPSATAEDGPPYPRETAAALEELKAMALSHHQELDNLFALHLQQQQELFNSFVFSTKRDNGHRSSDSGEIFPFDVLAEARKLETLPAGMLPALPEATVSPVPAEASEVVKVQSHISTRASNLFEKMALNEMEINSVRSTASEACPKEARFFSRWAFQSFISIIILVNTFMLGLVTQDRVTATMADRPAEPTWEFFELAFCVIFVLELVFRLATERIAFFCGKDWHWNLYDSIIVIHSLVDQVVKFAPNISFARVLRIVRFLRIMRLVRVLRGFTSFRLMVYSILGSMNNLAWIFLFIFLLLYSFALCFLYGVAEYFPEVDAGTQEEMRLYYSSLPACMLSLFMCITGGDDWANRMQPFKSLPSLYVCAFIFYIFFVVFGALNVVAAAFVETAAAVSRRDRDSIIEHQIKKKQHLADDIRDFFYAADSDGTGELKRDELSKYLQDDKVKASFSSLGVDVSQAIDLFDLLDSDDDGMITLEEFLSGCMRLQGTATSMDVNLLLWEVEKLTSKVTAGNQTVDRCAYWLEQLFGSSPHMRKQQPWQCAPRKKQLEAWTPEAKPRRLSELSGMSAFISLKRQGKAAD